MNRIDKLFQTKRKGILSVYTTAGFPRLNDTLPVIRALEAGGADMVEIGIPFSDPMADGPTIQQSSSRAIKSGMTLPLLFEQLADIRRSVGIPLILMGYLNPVMQYGIENFCRRCAETGIDGVIVPDLPFDDYLRDYKPLADRYGLRFVMLITPATSDERIRLIDRHTGGFIYMVSTASTTGAQPSFPPETVRYFERIDALGLKNPRLVGFGISNPDTFGTALDHASGAIIGSEFIKILSETTDPQKSVNQLLKNIGVE